jgi:hypothetical protein
MVCLKSSRTSEDGPLTKIVPGDENDKNLLFIGLNIRITELYVKQKGGTWTGPSFLPPKLGPCGMGRSCKKIVKYLLFFTKGVTKKFGFYYGW